MLRRLILGSAILLLLTAACSEARAEQPFGVFNLRTGLFRKLWQPFGDKPKPTRYPIVLAHGICGFDRLKWGPIEIRYFHDLEKHLRERGFEVYTTGVPATGHIDARAECLVREIRAKYPDTKVNIIAHSMGGLDARYAIAKLGMGDKIATVTMIGTPNHGTLLCDWAEYYASLRFPAVERFCKAVGIDTAGFHDLSVRHMMREFNPNVPDDPRVSYRTFAGSQSLPKYFLPLMATHTVLKSLEKTLARQKLDFADHCALGQIDTVHSLGYALSDRGLQDVIRNLPSDWLKPELVGKTDGLVSMSSVRHGTYLGNLDADHLDEMGWLTTFDAKGFYEAIATKLAEDGF